MSTTQTLVLGAIAGFTIFLGLPLGRVGGASPKMRAALTAFATGILLFLLWDVLAHGVEPVESAVEDHDWSRVLQLAPLLAGGLAVGLMSLVYYDRWMTGKRATPLVGPGAAAGDEFTSRSWIGRLAPGRRRAPPLGPGAAPGSPARPPDRSGNRPAQLRRGPRDRPGGRGGRGVARAR